MNGYGSKLLGFNLIRNQHQNTFMPPYCYPTPGYPIYISLVSIAHNALYLV